MKRKANKRRLWLLTRKLFKFQYTINRLVLRKTDYEKEQLSEKKRKDRRKKSKKRKGRKQICRNMKRREESDTNKKST